MRCSAGARGTSRVESRRVQVAVTFVRSLLASITLQSGTGNEVPMAAGDGREMEKREEKSGGRPGGG